MEPSREWRAISEECRDPSRSGGVRTAVAHIALGSMVAALAWGLGRWVLGGVPADTRAVLNVLVTWGLYVAASMSLAVAIAVLAPFYGCRRDAAGAIVVAAWASTPAFLAGMLVLVPVMMALVVVSLPFCCYLVYLGARHVLGVRRSDAAEFTAVALVLSVVLSAVSGHTLSAWGAI